MHTYKSPAGWWEESVLFSLCFCKIGGCTTKLVCSERSSLHSLMPPDDPRSSSISGDTRYPFSYSLAVYLLWKLRAFLRYSLPLLDSSPSPPSSTAMPALFDGSETFKCSLKSTLQQRGPFPRSDRFTPHERVAARCFRRTCHIKARPCHHPIG